MNPGLLLAYIVAVITLQVTPGPVVALVTGTAARYGARKAFSTVIGTNSASLVLIIMAASVLAGVVALPPMFLMTVGITGSLYIGWNALSVLRAGETASQTPEKAVVKYKSALITGFLTGIANPKDLLFFVSFFPQFIAVTDNFTTSIVTLTVVWVIFDFSVMSLGILLVRYWLPESYAIKIQRMASFFMLAVAIFGLLYNLAEIIMLAG